MPSGTIIKFWGMICFLITYIGLKRVLNIQSCSRVKEYYLFIGWLSYKAKLNYEKIKSFSATTFFIKF